jgi:hypothetical protein
MKTIYALSVLALVACKKDAIPARYEAECDLCYVEYQVDDDRLSTAKVEGRWDVFVVDTITVDSLPYYVLDSTRILATWSYSVDLEANTGAVLKLRNAAGSTISKASVTYGGKRKEAVATGWNEEVWAH